MCLLSQNTTQYSSPFLYGWVWFRLMQLEETSPDIVKSLDLVWLLISHIKDSTWTVFLLRFVYFNFILFVWFSFTAAAATVNQQHWNVVRIKTGFTMWLFSLVWFGWVDFFLVTPLCSRRNCKSGSKSVLEPVLRKVETPAPRLFLAHCWQYAKL